MQRRLLYIGAALFVIGLVLAFAAAIVLESVASGAQSPAVGELVLNASSVAYVPVALNQTGLIVFSYNSTSNIDFYFVNQSAFATIKGSTASGAGVLARELEGRGVYAVYPSSEESVFPYSGAAGAGGYAANASIMPQGTYYAVLANDGGSSAKVVTGYATIGEAALESSSISTLALSGMSFLLIVVGILLAIASFFVKAKAPAQQSKIDAEAKDEYARIEREGRKRPARKPKGRKKGKR
jgi:hypothetical protein